MILYFPAMWLCDKVGIRSCAVIGSVFQVVGLLIRLTAITGGLASYLFLLVGTLTVAIGYPFISDIPVALATRWFPEPERTSAMSAGAIAKFLGAGVGMVAIDPIHNMNDTASMVQYVLTWQAVFGVVAGCLCLIIFVDTPPEPPGLVPMSEVVGGRVERYSITTAFKAVFHAGYVWLLFIPVAVVSATTSMLLVSVDRIELPQEQKSTWIGLFFGLGISAAAVISVFNIMHDRLATLLARLMLGLSISFVLMSVGESLGGTVVAVGLVSAGIFSLPMVGIALKLAVNITRTEGLNLEGTVAAYLDLLGCLLSSMLFFTTDPSVVYSADMQMWIYLSLIVVCTIMVQAFARRQTSIMEAAAAKAAEEEASREAAAPEVDAGAFSRPRYMDSNDESAAEADDHEWDSD